MEFHELRKKIFNLYLERSFQEGLSVIERGRRVFPEEDSTLTFYEACFLSLAGEPALEVLEAGLDRGLGWHSKMLLDSDLDGARPEDGWDSFVARSSARVAEWGVAPPEPLLRVALDSSGTLITLAGVGDPERFFEIWRPAVPEDWTLFGLVGDVPVAKGEWAWPFDLSMDSLIDTVRALPSSPPVVLSGFSQGSYLAAKTAWNGEFETAGLILLAGPSPEAWSTSRERPVPSFIFVGAEDGARDGSVALSEALSRAGVPNVLEVRDGLGHELPEDLDQVVGTALNWIKTQG